jgi:hypothetical protein
MDHSGATKINAVERYVLGDLSVSDVEEFERHFFDCPLCSEELRLVSVLQDNARAVFIEQSLSPSPASLPAIPRGAGWWSGFLRPWVAAPAFAALVVAMFAGYEAGVRHQSNGLQDISAFPLYAAARGDETVISPPPGAQFYTMYMDRTWERDFPRYRSVVRDDPGGAERYSLRIPPPAPGRSIQVLAPAHALPAGRYVLVIFGADETGKETEVARYPFTLKFE